MKSRIVHNYVRFAAPKLNSFASSVYAAMTGNAHFPAPAPTLQELAAANQKYVAAIDAAQHFDRLKAEEKEKARDILVLVLQRLGNYVMVIAGDDRAIQLSAGFHVNSDRKLKDKDLGKPQNFSVELGVNSGEAWMSADVVNALTYIYYVTEAGIENPVWVYYSTDEKPFLVTGLKPLTMYRFRVKAIGYNGQSVSTEEIVKPVL